MSTLSSFMGTGVLPKVPWRAPLRIIARVNLTSNQVETLGNDCNCDIVRSRWGYITPICISGEVYDTIRAGDSLRIDPNSGASDADYQRIKQILHP